MLVQTAVLTALLCQCASAATIFPGASWTGTAGSGGAAPAESASLIGSGWPYKAIGNFDEPKRFWLEGDLEITVPADTGDDAGISEVEFWLEGVSQSVSVMNLNSRTGTIGYSITLDHSAFAQDGDCDLYAYVRPVNGCERRIGPLRFTVIGTGTAPITRAIRYISPSGNDTTGDGLTSGTPWKTVLKASRTAPSGAIVKMAPGTYLEDSNSGSLQSNARPITFEPASGVPDYTVVISRSSRTLNAGNWHPRCALSRFRGVHFDLAMFVDVNTTSGSNEIVFEDCELIDSNGVSGYAEGYWNGSPNDELSGTIFRSASTQYTALIDCTVLNYVSTGAQFYRGCDITVSADSLYPVSGSVILNTVVSQPEEMKQRLSELRTLTIATVSYNAGTNRTTITFSGSPTLSTSFDGNTYFEFQSGALDGQTFKLFQALDNTTKAMVVTGDASAAVAGDTGFAYLIFHADFFQAIETSTATVAENIIAQRLKQVGVSAQLMLSQQGRLAVAGTVSTTGTTATFSDARTRLPGQILRITNGSQSGEYRQIVAVNSTTEVVLESAFSVDQSGRTYRIGNSLKDVALQLCIFHKTDASSTIGQWQHGEVHFVIRQCDMLGAATSFRTDTDAFGLSGAVIKDCIFDSFAFTGAAFPSVGITIDNNHFESGTVRGTNGTGGDVEFSNNYFPTGFSHYTMSPRLLWDYSGRSYQNNGSDPVGAVVNSVPPTEGSP